MKNSLTTEASSESEDGEAWGVEQLGSRPQLRPATGTHMVLELDRNLSTAPAGAASATSV